TDRVFLLLGGQRIPLREVGHVALDGDVAAAGVFWVLIADDRPETALVAHRILSTVHEADEVTIVHVGKAVCLVEDLDRIAELVDDGPPQLVTEVAAMAANVEEKVARRGRGRARTVAERPERVQLRGPRPSGRKVFPGFGADRHDAAQAGTRVTAPDAAHERRHVRAYAADAGGRPLARLHRQAPA